MAAPWPVVPGTPRERGTPRGQQRLPGLQAKFRSPDRYPGGLELLPTPTPTPRASSTPGARDALANMAGSPAGSVYSPVASGLEAPATPLGGATWKAEAPTSPLRSARSKRRPQPTITCSNWGGGLGQLSLLSVSTSVIESAESLHSLVVRYDMRPAVAYGILQQEETACLAVLDMERLRRKGSGMGLDALQASENWIARDCLVSKTGKLRALDGGSSPGEVKVSLGQPLPGKGGDASVMLRVVAVRNVADSQDWRALGAPLVLRIRAPSERSRLDAADLEQRLEKVSKVVAEGVESDAPSPEGCGIKVQQLIDFYGDIREDLEKYCSVHRVYEREGKHKGCHVCLHSPCPYRPIDKSKYDDHRGLPFMQAASLHPAELESCLGDLAATTDLVIKRFVHPAVEKSGKCMALTMNADKPLRFTAFVTHAWGELFEDFMETLEAALDVEEVIFDCGFCLGPAEADEQPPRPEEDPSAAALRRAEKLVVAVGCGSRVFGRLWCLREICKAREWNVPTFVWPHRGSDIVRLEDAVSALDVHVCRASEAVGARGAREDLLASLRLAQLGHAAAGWGSGRPGEEAGGPDAANLRLRVFIQARLATYEAAVRQTAEGGRASKKERLRHLLCEHERRAALLTLEEEHTSYIERLGGVLEGLQRTLEEERAEHDSDRRGVGAQQEELRRAMHAQAEQLAAAHSELEGDRELLGQATERLGQLERQVKEERGRGDAACRELTEEQLQKGRLASRCGELEAELDAERGRSHRQASLCTEAAQGREDAAHRLAESEEQRLALETKLGQLEAQMREKDSILEESRMHLEHMARREEEHRAVVENLTQERDQIDRTKTELSDLLAAERRKLSWETSSQASGQVGDRQNQKRSSRMGMFGGGGLFRGSTMAFGRKATSGSQQASENGRHDSAAGSTDGRAVGIIAEEGEAQDTLGALSEGEASPRSPTIGIAEGDGEAMRRQSSRTSRKSVMERALSGVSGVFASERSTRSNREQ